MNDTYLQTIVEGCAWCRSVMGVSTHEVKKHKQENFIVLSHGICPKCKAVMEQNLLAQEKDDDLVGV